MWAHLCYNDVQSLLFCDSRKLTELAVDRAKTFLRTPGLPYRREPSLASYNAGHGKESRRGTEYQLREGVLDGVATTSALEVGINVGGVDGTVLMGYPGSRQSFWQRIGRSGRGTRDALSVFVPSHATLDRYILEHPGYVLESEHESAVVDLENNPVYLRHVACAAQELPLTREDGPRFGGVERLERAVEYGRRTGDLEGSLDGGVTYAHRDRPQDAVSLYASGGNAFDVRLAGDDSLDHQPIGRERAYRDYHEGATVLYRGDQYQVVELREDVPQPYVELEPVDVDYYTQSQGQVSIYDTEAEESRDVGGFRLNWGYGTVSVHYATYLKREMGSGDVREMGLRTGVEPLTMRTQLCWAELPDDVDRAVRNKHSGYHNPECTGLPPRLHGFLGGVHAVEHAMIAVAPLELKVDDADLGGLATNRLPGNPDASGWFVYDGVEGGVGFARGIYESFEAVARRARDLVRDCSCGRAEGCPACTMDDRCGNDNRPLYSPAATDVLDALLGGDPEAVWARRAQVQRQFDNAPPNVERDKLAQRLARLTGGTAVILVGGATPVEQKRLVQILDDSLNAARCAREEGVVPGGGTALVQAAPVLDRLLEDADGGAREGIGLFRRALFMPLSCIAENCGQNGSDIAQRVLESPPGVGFEARGNRFVDMIEAGVMDPVRVTRLAVENATSVARLILTTHTLIADRPDTMDPTDGPCLGGGAEKLGRQ